MVTFRFYVVSIVAFFLALAVGIVVGSALDQRIADGLEGRVEEVQSNLDDTVERVEQKNREIEQLESVIAATEPHLVDGRLADTFTLVVAESGVDRTALTDAVTTLRRAGSRVAAVVWLDERWNLSTAEDRTVLGGVLDDAASARPPTEPEALRRAVWEQLLEELTPAVGGDGADGTTSPSTVPGDPSGAPTTTVEQPTTTAVPVDVVTLPTLVALGDRGFVAVERMEDDDLAGGTTPLIVSVIQPLPSDEDGAERTEASTTAPIDLVSVASSSEIPIVVAEVAAADTPADERGGRIRELRRAPMPGASTVDDLELVAGRVAMVLALEQLRDGGPSGDYGHGPDVDGVIPPWLGD